MTVELHPDQVWDGWVFLKHVAGRIHRRGITIAEVVETLNHPLRSPFPSGREGAMLYAGADVFVAANWMTKEVITAYRPTDIQRRRAGVFCCPNAGR